MVLILIAASPWRAALGMGMARSTYGSSLFYSQSPKWQVCNQPILQRKELRLTEGRNLPMATQYIRSRAGISAEAPVIPATVCTVDKQKCLKPS